MKIDQVVLDRKNIRVRKCWWASSCCTHDATSGEWKDEEGKKHPALHWKQGYIVEVEEAEARTGKGRQCPFCRRTNGSYICDGFPTFSATTVLPLGGEEYEHKREGSRITKG